MLRRALLRDAQSGGWLDFGAPGEVLCARRPQDVAPLLDRVAGFCTAGGWAAGYLTYEAGAGLQHPFPPSPAGAGPLALFGLHTVEPARTAAAPMLATAPGANRPDPQWRIDEPYAVYAGKLARIRAAIGRGDVYQVNHTLRFLGHHVQPGRLFDHAARSAPYGAWLELDEAVVVSASPELFFALDGGEITSVPMKGTAARCNDACRDRAQKRWLARSAKNRAENLMITDMVRNDLGRIARIGSVCTRRLFHVQALPTVWQMTSTVSARTRASLTEIFRALFPAASITGAPKIAATALIGELESTPRGVYTGTVGFVGPGWKGLRAQFNVAIRTAWVPRGEGTAVYGVGGGIVWDSKPEEEYAEARLKARLLNPAPAPRRND